MRSLSGCLHSCLPGDGVPMVHTNKPPQLFCLTLILEKPFICFSEEAAIEIWTFREWEGNLLNTKEDCRCKMFVMLKHLNKYITVPLLISFLLTAFIESSVQLTADLLIRQLDKNKVTASVLSYLDHIYVTLYRSGPGQRVYCYTLWWPGCSLLPVYMNSLCLRGKASLLINCNKVLCCPTSINKDI